MPSFCELIDPSQMSNVFLFSLFAPVSQTGKKQARYSIFLIIKNFQRPPTLSGDSYFSVPIRMFRHSRFVIKPSGIVLMSVTSYRTISVEENQKKYHIRKTSSILPETIPKPDCYRTLPRPTSISHFGQLDGGTLTRMQQPKRRKHPKKKNARSHLGGHNNPKRIRSTTKRHSVTTSR